MYKIYILDFDGTIADTNMIVTRTMQQTLAELGYPERTREECSKTIGLPLAGCFKALMPMSDAQAQECCTVYTRLFEENKKEGRVPVFPGAVESIRRWHDQGAKVTIASSRGHDTLDDFLRDMGLSAYVSYVLGGDDVERAKPDPCPVLMTLDRFAIAPEDAVVIGDMAYDVLMGKRAGCHTVGVTYGNGSVDELKEAGVEIVTDDLSTIG